MKTYLYSMEIIKSDVLTIEHREISRKHRQKRIQKKFIKKYGYNYSLIPDPKVIIMGNKIIGHTKVIEKMLELAGVQGEVREY